MNVEVWTEKHQFALWIVSIALSVAVSLLASELRAFIAAVPRGLRRARDAYRAATLSRLELYRDHPAMLTRILVANCSASIALMGLVGIHYMDNALKQKVSHSSVLDLFRDAAFNQFSALILGLNAMLCGFVGAGSISLFIVWLYRDPVRRINHLRSLLPNQNGSIQTEAQAGRD